ncbi:MAG TPA: MFS transporter, partial [Afipia sp.]
FVAVAVAAVLAAVLIAAFLPETRLPENRLKASASHIFGSFGRLLTNPRFLGLVFIGGFGMASFFAFLASSSFIYINHFGLTPTQYSLGFSVNAVGFIGASQFAAALGLRFGMARMVKVAASLYALFAVILFLVTSAGFSSLPVLMVLLFLSFASLGLVIPSSMVLAMDDHGPIAGMASSLAGTLQMLSGGVVVAVASFFFDGTAYPMVTIIALCACCALGLSLLTLRGRPEQVAQLAE